MQNKINSKSKLIELKLNELEELKKTSKFWNIEKKQGEILSNLVFEKNPTSILEIGTSNGYSTLYLVKNLNQNSTLTTIEVNEDRLKIAKKNFEDCKISNIIQIHGEITQILSSKKLSNQKFDFIFLDAMQREYLNLIKTFENENMFLDNITITADNVLSHGNMTQFLEYMQKNYDTKIENIGKGLLIANKKTNT